MRLGILLYLITRTGYQHICPFLVYLLNNGKSSLKGVTMLRIRIFIFIQIFLYYQRIITL